MTERNGVIGAIKQDNNNLKESLNNLKESLENLRGQVRNIHKNMTDNDLVDSDDLGVAHKHMETGLMWMAKSIRVSD